MDTDNELGKLARLAGYALTAGLKGERLPDLGRGISSSEIEMINHIYAIARGWAAGATITNSRL